MRISDWSSDVCSSDLISSSVSPFTSRSNAFERAACSLCCWPQDFSGAAIVRAFVGVGADVFSIDGLPEDVGFQKLGQGELVAVAALRRRDAAGLESRRCDLDEGLSPNLDIGLVANAILLRALLRVLQLTRYPFPALPHNRSLSLSLPPHLVHTSLREK